MRGRCRFLSKSAVRHFTYQTNVSAMDAVDNHRKFFENNYFSLGGIVALLVRPFADDAVHFEHVLAKLLKRESEREKSLRRFAFHVARQSLVAHRAEFLDVIPERELDGFQWRRRLLVAERNAAGAEEVASRRLDVFEWR